MMATGYIEHLAEQMTDPEFAKEFVKVMKDYTELTDLINKQSALITALKEDGEYWLGVAEMLQSPKALLKVTESTQYAKHATLIERVEKEGM